MNLPSRASFLLVLSLATGEPIAAEQEGAGQISGHVNDSQGAAVVNAAVFVRDQSAQKTWRTRTDAAGRFEIGPLDAGRYELEVESQGFSKLTIAFVIVTGDETSVSDVRLRVAPLASSIDVTAREPTVALQGPALAERLDGRTTTELPLATRNYTQLLGLVGGASTYLNDNRISGRLTLPVSIDGARATHNDYRLNGVDANDIAGNSPRAIAIPAPESLESVTVQTSLFDATEGRAGGGLIQAVTRSGGESVRGDAYASARHEGLAANDPELKAAGVDRPVLRRYVFGATIGGPLRTGRTFFFASGQGTDERNGYNGIYSNVLVARGLTDDRSASTLLNTFAPALPDGSLVSSIDPIALQLLNARHANGAYLIPTPGADGRVSGFEVFRYREGQFNGNVTHKPSLSDVITGKFFLSNAPSFDPLAASNLPGFGLDGRVDNRVLALSELHAGARGVANEFALGYNFIRNQDVPRQSINDADLGLYRPTSSVFPGLPLISIANDAGGAVVGSPLINAIGRSSTLTVRDMLTLSAGTHRIRTGGEARWYRNAFNASAFSRGYIEFSTFNDFLVGVPRFSFLGSGIPERDLRAADLDLFIQDDWRLSPALTLNLGLRYALDLPPFETLGRLSTFDPTQYRPPTRVIEGMPVGPPSGGLVQADNAAPGYDLPNVPNVDRRIVNSVDKTNFAPRIGAEWSPLPGGRWLVRGGYGRFYSRGSFEYAAVGLVSPPFWITTVGLSPSFAAPFPPIPPPSAFPLISSEETWHFLNIDRNLHTPYFDHLNGSVQADVGEHATVLLAFASSRGRRLLRQPFINQARLATATNPIINDATGALITTNTIANAPLRAPFQGIGQGGAGVGFPQVGTNGRSLYRSFRATFSRREFHGWQILASYTLSRSEDDSSGTGGGAHPDGTLNVLETADSAVFPGDQLGPDANYGLSDFDRTHRLVIGFVWELPGLSGPGVLKALVRGWQVSGLITAMSGLPIDIVDSLGGSIYGMAGARPNWAPGADRHSAFQNIPIGYWFNPSAFSYAVLQPGQPIPSSGGAAVSDDVATDFGNVRRNVLRGPGQRNVDLAVTKRVYTGGSTSIDLRAEFFNLLNQVNYANPLSDVQAVIGSGGSIDERGRILNAGDFGRILYTSSSPRVVQLQIRLRY